MIAFDVNDMTCGHCAGTITSAVQAADAAARVEIDLGRRQVRIDVEKSESDTDTPVKETQRRVPQPVTSQKSACGLDLPDLRGESDTPATKAAAAKQWRHRHRAGGLSIGDVPRPRNVRVSAVRSGPDSGSRWTKAAAP